MRISDWSSDVCSSDLDVQLRLAVAAREVPVLRDPGRLERHVLRRQCTLLAMQHAPWCRHLQAAPIQPRDLRLLGARHLAPLRCALRHRADRHPGGKHDRSEEHTSELQSLMRISYAVFCLKKKKPKTTNKQQQTIK